MEKDLSKMKEFMLAILRKHGTFDESEGDDIITLDDEHYMKLVS